MPIYCGCATSTIVPTVDYVRTVGVGVALSGAVAAPLLAVARAKRASINKGIARCVLAAMMCLASAFGVTTATAVLTAAPAHATPSVPAPPSLPALNPAFDI